MPKKIQAEYPKIIKPSSCWQLFNKNSHNQNEQPVYGREIVVLERGHFPISGEEESKC